MPVATVLDVNVLRNDRLIAALIARFRSHGEHIILPEMVLVEQTNDASKWESTIEQSFRGLARCPDAVIVSGAGRSLSAIEESSGEPVASMVSDAGSAAMRMLLQDMAIGGGAYMDAFRESVHWGREKVGHDRFAAYISADTPRMVSLARSSISRADRAAVNRSMAKKDRTLFRELLVRSLDLQGARDARVRRGVAPHIADALSTAPSVSYLSTIAICILALEWSVMGGIEKAPTERMVNDSLDVEYIVAGFWFGRLINDDGRSRTRFDDLRAIGRELWPSWSQWFDRATVHSTADAMSSFLSI